MLAGVGEAPREETVGALASLVRRVRSSGIRGCTHMGGGKNLRGPTTIVAADVAGYGRGTASEVEETEFYQLCNSRGIGVAVTSFLVVRPKSKIRSMPL